MSNHLKIVVITDGTPISESLLGTGMCRVNTQLFLALSHNIEIIASTTLGGRYIIDDIDPQIKDRTILIDLPKPIRTVAKVIGRFSEVLRSENLAFQLKLPQILKEIHEKSVDWIFCPCGVDPSALGRAVHLAQKANLPLAVYLVDDFMDGAILSGNQRHLRIAEQNVHYWLSKVDKVFVISEGFRQQLKRIYNIDSTVLLLPYSLPDISEDAQKLMKKQVLYLGGLSHFYIDGLRQVAQAINVINQETGNCIVLRIVTQASNNYIKSLLGDYDFIQCDSSCNSAEDVRKEVSLSSVCFAPYSFQNKFRTMVSTSFPSKTMDYLAAGKFILVYGPDYSSSVNYFKDNYLPEVLITEDTELLQQMISKQISDPKDYSENYKFSLQEYHSYSKIANTVLSNLNIKSNEII